MSVSHSQTRKMMIAPSEPYVLFVRAEVRDITPKRAETIIRAMTATIAPGGFPAKACPPHVRGGVEEDPEDQRHDEDQHGPLGDAPSDRFRLHECGPRCRRGRPMRSGERMVEVKTLEPIGSRAGEKRAEML